MQPVRRPSVRPPMKRRRLGGGGAEGKEVDGRACSKAMSLGFWIIC